jgi:hypothetical protein
MAKLAAQPEVVRPQEPDAPIDAAHLAEPAPSPAVIHLADLVPDANRDIVLFNDSALRSLVLKTDVRVVERGRSGAHVTLGGDDVSGYTFLRFDNGLRLHVPAELDLVVEHEDS